MEQVREQVEIKLGDDWEEEEWTTFIIEVGEWLLQEGKSTKKVGRVLVGLIRCGAITEEELQAISDDKDKFEEKLEKRGIPIATGSQLFDKYVGKKAPNAKEICENVLNKYLSDVERPVLKVFQRPDDSQIEFQTDVEIPKFPTGNYHPYVLLYDVANEKYKETESFKFLKEIANYPRTIYGTSGAGKTRRVFEFLSHEYGLYFVANGGGIDPGSIDMSLMIEKCSDKVHYAQKSNGDPQKESKNNLKIVTEFVKILVYSRMKVFERLQKLYQEKFGVQMSPYEWLLFQLHPNAFLT